jgi:hypothetical protein
MPVIAGLFALLVGYVVGVGSRPTLRSKTLPNVPDSPVSAWWRTGIGTATLLLGLLFCAFLIALAVWLGVRLWDGTVATSAPQAAGGDSIANALTAISTLVTVTTLVITGGAAYLGRLLQHQEAGRMHLKAALARADLREQLAIQMENVKRHRLEAERATLRWLQVQTDPRLLALRQLELQIDLQELSSTDRAARRPAFLKLADLFQPYAEGLDPVRRYTEECHRLEMLRSWLADYAHAMERDATPGFGSWTELERHGVACRFFDPAEQDRVLRHP